MLDTKLEARSQAGFPIVIWLCFGFQFNKTEEGKSRGLPSNDASINIDAEEEEN